MTTTMAGSVMGTDAGTADEPSPEQPYMPNGIENSTKVIIRGNAGFRPSAVLALALLVLYCSF